MPPLPVIADTYRCALKWVDGATGQIAVNVMHIQKAGTSAAAVATELDTKCPVNFGVASVTSASVRSLAITPLDGASATYQVDTTNAHWTGSQSGDFVPSAAAVVGITTAKRGRSYRGRLFIPFVAEAVIADGLINSTIASELRGAWNTYFGDLFADGFKSGVASYKLAHFEGGAIAHVLEAYGTQRRRQERVRYP